MISDDEKKRKQYENKQDKTRDGEGKTNSTKVKYKKTRERT